jgi:hypothetical protein
MRSGAVSSYRTLPALLLVLAACRAVAPRSGSLPYEVLVEGYQSGAHRAGAMLITTEEDWQSFWRRHTSWRIPPAPEPKVDFQAHSVIVICAGDEPTSGWTLATSSVAHGDGRIVVHAELHAPAAGAVMPQVVTQPYQILLVERTSGTAVLELE